MPAYYEVIIKGDDKSVRAYIEGFMRGRGVKKGYGFGRDHALDLSHIRDLVKYHGDVVHLVVSGTLRANTEKALRDAPEYLKLSVVASRKIVRSYFHFKFETFNRPVAGQIKRLLGNLPRGVQLTDFAPEEIVDPKAMGVERYAPAHPYTYKGAGVAEGDPDGVRILRKKMAANEFISAGDTVLHTGD